MDVNGLFSLVCAVTAVINPGIYADFVEERYINGTIAQDIMAIFASIILLIISHKINDKSYIKQVVGLGLLGFFFYAYGVYVLNKSIIIYILATWLFSRLVFSGLFILCYE